MLIHVETSDQFTRALEACHEFDIHFRAIDLLENRTIPRPDVTLPIYLIVRDRLTYIRANELGAYYNVCGNIIVEATDPNLHDIIALACLA